MPPGILQFLHGQLLEGVPKLSSTDLSGHTYIVTGANSGLGLDCVQHLMHLGASRIVLGCRDVTKGEEAKATALASISTSSSKFTCKPASNTSGQGGHTTELLVRAIDLSVFASVVEFADRCSSELHRVDGLIANAGVSPRDYKEAEGFEQTLTVNVLSTFLLAKCLVPKLRQSAREFDILPRISVVGSFVHFVADTTALRKAERGAVFETLTRNGGEKDKTDWVQRYNLSKLLVTMGVRRLAAETARESESGEPFVVVNDVHPGYCRTGLFRDAGGWLREWR